MEFQDQAIEKFIEKLFSLLFVLNVVSLLHFIIFGFCQLLSKYILLCLFYTGKQ